MGEVSLFGRTGGAATLAVGMAKIFGSLTHDRWLDLWYHFAIMFEALFILTTLDAGTRVGRYLLQDACKRLIPSFGDTKNFAAGVIASALIVVAWGSFLIMGVRDPDGGVKALWPIFGIANQLLASIALCLATTILLKMQIQRGKSPVLALVTLIPLAWLLTVTISAGASSRFGTRIRRSVSSLALMPRKVNCPGSSRRSPPHKPVVMPVRSPRPRRRSMPCGLRISTASSTRG